MDNIRKENKKMKYYVIEIAEGDAKIKGKAIYEYESKDKALASYHKKLGTAMDSDLYTESLVIAVDSTGLILALEKYTAEKPTEEEI